MAETWDTDLSRRPRFTAQVEGYYGEFILEPLERGFGVTLGNPLRRILMSSIPGTAVTSVYIEDALHEFSVLPGVKEDVVQIVLALKDLVVKLYEPGPKTLSLHAEGARKVTAADLEVPSGAEILNPEIHLATLEAGAKLRMEIRVDQGVGYVPAEVHGTKDRINSIPIDAIFSPVRRVAYQVEDTRLGQRTDLDKLILRIWTDGSLSPEAALDKAVEIMRSQLEFFEQAPQVSEPALISPVPIAISEEGPVVERTSLGTLGFSPRVLHNLQEEGIDSVESLLALTERDLKKIPGIGEQSLKEIKDHLQEQGYELKE